MLLTISSLKVFVAVYEDDQGFAYTADATKSHTHSGRGTKLRTWRSSRLGKDLTMTSSRWDEESIFQLSSLPSFRGQEIGVSGVTDVSVGVGDSSGEVSGKGIMKSVQISVTRESIELENRGTTEVLASGGL